MLYESPVVSIGLTSYDKPIFLSLTLQNLLSQTYKNIELVVALDAPPNPKTIEIAKSFAQKDKRVRLFIHKENIGPDANTRFVLDKATGDFFFWADEDDLRDHDWVEQLIKPFVDEKILVSSGRVQNIDQEGLKLSRFSKVQFRGSKIYKTLCFFLQPERHGKCNLIYSIFRTKVLLETKHWTFYQSNKFEFGDNIFAFYHILNGGICYNNEVTFYKRLHDYDKEELKLMPNRFKRGFNYFFYSLECAGIIKQRTFRFIFYSLIPIKMFVLFFDLIRVYFYSRFK